MEKQMRAERERRAVILNAEGSKQAQILTAEGEKQAMVLRADGDRQARILEADGQAKAISTVFSAIHTANPDAKVMAYQYLQALPQIAEGAANKVWVLPIELTRALDGIGSALGGLGLGAAEDGTTSSGPTAAPAATAATAEAVAAAEQAAATAAEAAAVAAAEADDRRGLPASPGRPAGQVLSTTDRPVDATNP
jgi:hypothetical protein